MTEGDAGTLNAVFTVTLSDAYRLPISVNVSSADGTANAGADYFGLPSTHLSFAPGVTSIMVTVPVIGDTLMSRTRPSTSISPVPYSGHSAGFRAGLHPGQRSDPPPAARRRPRRPRPRRPRRLPRRLPAAAR